jgi:hypothetical protein
LTGLGKYILAFFLLFKTKIKKEGGFESKVVKKTSSKHDE